MAYYDGYVQRCGAKLPATNIFHEEFQAKIDEEFEFASNVYTIEKETDTNGEYEDISVRLSVPYQIQQMTSIRDDYRQISFSSMSFTNILGQRYRFNNYIWIALDVGRMETPTNSCIVQRCSDYLRFYDEYGIYHEIPSTFLKKGMYDLKDNRYVILPDNQFKCYLKYDDESRLLKFADVTSEHQKYTRFIIQGYAFRIVRIDRSSYTRLGIGYMEIILEADQINGYDDVVNCIADKYLPENIASISILIVLRQVLLLHKLCN
jgi:hypothetical protein